MITNRTIFHWICSRRRDLFLSIFSTKCIRLIIQLRWCRNLKKSKMNVGSFQLKKCISLTSTCMTELHVFWLTDNRLVRLVHLIIRQLDICGCAVNYPKDPTGRLLTYLIIILKEDIVSCQIAVKMYSPIQ